MSPEQALDHLLTPISDIFGLGATAHFAATGRPPFGEGNAAALMFRVTHSEPDQAPPAGLSEPPCFPSAGRAVVGSSNVPVLAAGAGLVFIGNGFELTAIDASGT